MVPGQVQGPFTGFEQIDAVMCLKKHIFMNSQDPNSLIFSTGLTFYDQNWLMDPLTSPPNK